VQEIPTCRAAYLIPFIDVLRDIGVPVERELARANLPPLIEETPDDSISNILAFKFLARNEHRQGIDDLGWLWSKRFSLSNLSEELLAALRPLPTVKSRLDRIALLSRLEDTSVQVGLVQSSVSAEVYCDITSPQGLNGTHIGEWTQVKVLIEIVRSIMGKNWSPEVINFKSNFSVCNAAREETPDTRFVTNANHTSIVMSSSVLAMGKAKTRPTCSLETFENLSDCGLNAFVRLLRPYLRGGTPKIELLAEIAGTSRRTLQRKLQKAGVSYSELVETTRFLMATEMLEDPDIPLIEVALMFGYENQSNFGRNFRGISGMSPGKYRRQMLELN